MFIVLMCSEMWESYQYFFTQVTVNESGNGWKILKQKVQEFCVFGKYEGWYAPLRLIYCFMRTLPYREKVHFFFLCFHFQSDLKSVCPLPAFFPAVISQLDQNGIKGWLCWFSWTRFELIFITVLCFVGVLLKGLSHKA